MRFKSWSIAMLVCLSAACHTPANDVPPTPVADDAQASPWDAARARGVVFRGIGTEPGWSVEVGGGPRPTLQALLDYGERTVHVSQATAVAGGLAYAGSASDGAQVRLQLEREECSDGMSDQRYPLSATLTVDEQRYQGCGRLLQR
jgi:uncharacterized membrane protein